MSENGDLRQRFLEGVKKRYPLRVSSLMTRDVVTLDASHDLELAQEIMSLGHFRHLPVIDSERAVIGLVTHRDLLRELARAYGPFDERDNKWFGKKRVATTVPVESMMSANPVTISADASAAEAASVLLKNQFGCLPVVEQGKLVGIITEADFLTLFVDVMSS